MERTYLIVYLIYGIVYILMGFIALASSRTSYTFKFYKHLPNVAYFAIIHGISELITVIVISELFFEMGMFFFVFKRILKALSFIFLFKFAFCFYGDIKKKLRYRLPEFVFIAWFVVLMLLLRMDLPQSELAIFFSVTIRYAMALPMGLFVAYTLFRIRADYPDISGLEQILKLFAFLFFVYAIVDGLFVRSGTFFPANVFNNDSFKLWFMFPIQYVKILIGIAASILLVKADELLRKYEINQLESIQTKIASESERVRIQNMIHDNTIQKLFSAGLMLESISDTLSNEQREYTDLSIKQLNESMGDLRKMIYDDRTDTSKSLAKLIDEFITSWQFISPIRLSYQNDLSDQTELSINSFQKSQCVWIIQEMLVNAIKHSKGTMCKISISEFQGMVYIKASDDGKGFKVEMNSSTRKYGLSSLQTRSKQLNGVLKIDSTKEGSVVCVSFPINKESNND